MRQTWSIDASVGVCDILDAKQTEITASSMSEGSVSVALAAVEFMAKLAINPKKIGYACSYKDHLLVFLRVLATLKLDNQGILVGTVDGLQAVKRPYMTF